MDKKIILITILKIANGLQNFNLFLFFIGNTVAHLINCLHNQFNSIQFV